MVAWAGCYAPSHCPKDRWLGAPAARSLRPPVVRSRHVSIAIRSALVYRLADRIVTSGEVVRALVVAARIPPPRGAATPPGGDTARVPPPLPGTAPAQELGPRARGAPVGPVAH